MDHHQGASTNSYKGATAKELLESRVKRVKDVRPQNVKDKESDDRPDETKIQSFMDEKLDQISQIKSKFKIKSIDVVFDGSPSGYSFKSSSGHHPIPKSRYEAIFSMDTCHIQLMADGLPLSLQEAYEVLLKSEDDIDAYHIYAYLRRAGFRVDVVTTCDDSDAIETQDDCGNMSDMLDIQIGHSDPSSPVPKRLRPDDAAESSSGDPQTSSGFRWHEYQLPSRIHSCENDWREYKELLEKCKLKLHQVPEDDPKKLPTGHLFETEPIPLMNPAKCYKPHELYARLQETGPQDDDELDDKSDHKSYTTFRIRKGNIDKFVYCIPYADGPPDESVIKHLHESSSGSPFVVAVVIDGTVQLTEYNPFKMYNEFPGLWLGYT